MAHYISPYLIQLVTAADACWLTRRNSAFCSAIVRTIDVPGSNVRGKIVACQHLGHEEMEVPEDEKGDPNEEAKEAIFLVNVHDRKDLSNAGLQIY